MADTVLLHELELHSLDLIKPLLLCTVSVAWTIMTGFGLWLSILEEAGEVI